MDKSISIFIVPLLRATFICIYPRFYSFITNITDFALFSTNAILFFP